MEENANIFYWAREASFHPSIWSDMERTQVCLMTETYTMKETYNILTSLPRGQ